MITTDSYTITEKLLLAAADVAKLRSPWFLEDLVLIAWKKWPETFGLRNNKQKHPSDNTVKAALCGKKGMVGRGCFVKVAKNTFELSRIGQEFVKRLKDRADRLEQQSVSAAIIERLKGSLIWKLKQTDAYIAEQDDGRGMLTFSHAQSFFAGIEKTRDEVLRELTELAFSDDDDAGDAREMMHLASHLIGRFERQWAIHDERTAKR